MTTSTASPQPKTTTALIVLGCLVVTACLGLVLIGIAAYSWLPLARAPIETLLARQPVGTPVTQLEVTQAPAFQPTRAPAGGPTQVPTLEEKGLLATATLVPTQPVEVPAWPMGYLDDYSWNTYTWYTGAVENDYWQGQWQVVKGKYHVELTALQDFATWEYMSAVSMGDFGLSADIEMIEASSAAEGGVILRGTDNNFYAFLVSSDGYYWFGLLYNDEWQTITDWTYTDAIYTDRANHLAVFCEGAQFKFFINDQFMGEAEDSRLKLGQAGVIVETVKDASVTFEFDNFELSAPAEAQADPEMSSAAMAGLQGKILFAANPDGNYDIYSVNADGSELARLTETSSDEYEPAWSPDGKQVVFVSNRDGNPELYRMNAEGSEVVRLTIDSAEDSSPAWSPDGSQIAFVTWRDGNPELYQMDGNGENLKRLTDNEWRDFAPSWSPDGTQIAFLSDQEWDLNIFILNLEDSQVTQFTRSSYTGSQGLAWSPDGQQIAFVSHETGSSELYLRDIQTNVETRLTNNAYDDLLPAWSGDGQYLTFVSAREGSYQIYVMNIAEGSLFRLTENPAQENTPGWGSH